MATLSLPAARDTHYLVYAAGAKSVLAELWGSPDRRIALAVAPGRYVVQRRYASNGAAAQLAIAAGEERKLDDRDFSASTLDAVAAKGTSPDADRAPAARAPERHHEITAGWAAGGDTRTGFVQGPRAGYAYAWRSVAVGIGGGVDLSSRSLESTNERLVTGFGRASIELRLPVSSTTTLRLGGGGRAGWMAQTLEPTASAASTAKTTHDGGFVGGPEIYGALRVMLGSWIFADVGAMGDVLLVREEGKTRGITGAAATGTLGAGF